jgi:biotin operon repressor
MATNLKRKLLSKTIGKTAYWSLNKEMVKSIGLESTLILQHIIDLQELHKRDEVFQSQPDMANELGISEYSVKNKIVDLTKAGYINVVKKGVPCKNFYTTNDDKIINILVNGLDHTKSTDLPVDQFSSYEINGLDNTDSTDKTISNQRTSDTEIVSTISKNTEEEYKNKNTEQTYSKQMITNMVDKFAERIDNRFKLNSFIIEVDEDWGGWDNFLEIAWGNDTSVKKNFTNKLNQYKNGIFAK